EVWPVIQGRRRGRAGARLHVRIVGLFSIIAATPAILVAIVANLILDRGLDRLLAARGLISNTLVVAEIYGLEHLRTMRGDTIAMAIALTQAKPLFDQDRDRFRQLFSAQSSLRGMPVAMLVSQDGSTIVKSDFNPARDEIAPPPASVLAKATAKASDTEAQIIPVPENYVLGGIIKLRGYEDTFLFVMRRVDPRVIEVGRQAKAVLAAFDDLQSHRLGFQLAFALMFAVIALSVLLSAVWVGLNFVNLLVAPIRR